MIRRIRQTNRSHSIVIQVMIKYITKYIIFVLLFASTSCTVLEQEPFSFVQLCDPQLGMGGYEHDVKSFQLAVEKINEIDCDFVVICGDLVHHAADSAFADFLKIKQEFIMPCYLTPGNHDIGKVPNDTTLTYYRKTIGPDYYEFQHKGYSFIVTNSQLWIAHVENESEKHDAWFKETLKQQRSKKYPVFVIGHYPLYKKSPDEEEHYFNFSRAKRKEILELFTENNVIAYLSGHTHKLVINNYRNVQLVSGETTSKNFDKRPFGYRLWQVSSDTTKHQFVSIQSNVPVQPEASGK